MNNHTKELIENAHKGDRKARERLVLENMGLIGSIVKRFAGRGYEQEDLFQIGSIGLIKAVDKFDTSFDVKFSTYAVPMITGEIKRFLRDDGMIKVSRTLKENAVKTARAVDEYRKKHLKEPTVEIISQMTGISVEDIVMSFEASADIESIYKTVYQGDGSEVQLIDRLPEKKDFNDELTFDTVEDNSLIPEPNDIDAYTYMQLRQARIVAFGIISDRDINIFERLALYIDFAKRIQKHLDAERDELIAGVAKRFCGLDYRENLLAKLKSRDIASPAKSQDSGIKQPDKSDSSAIKSEAYEPHGTRLIKGRRSYPSLELPPAGARSCHHP